MRVVETIDPNSSSEDVPDNSPSTLTPLISNPGPPTGIYFFMNIFFFFFTEISDIFFFFKFSTFMSFTLSKIGTNGN